jgi:20S proteasome alpha/beta subunit
MTIAVGFRCVDGVVVCTDSEHTAGQAKHYAPKIFQAVADNARLYIAGAGNDVYIGGVSKEIASDVKGKSMDFDSIESLAQKRVMEVYDSHIAPARKAGDPGAPSMALLLAVQIKELEARLYRIEETGGIHLVDMGLAVVGTEAAETLVRGLASIFVMDYYTSVFTMHVIAII